ncbi:MAG: NHLP bacteriocin export ABC transporter permease/ATPase subunit [Desulfobacterales bacterium]|nr:NHLP bacteriocin export ABC transporter permease/ATPase subunit [Desulfobacterales bacterium]
MITTLNQDTKNVSIAELLKKFGKLQEVSGNQPFLLNEIGNFWYVESGRVEIFTVNLMDGIPVGSRSHFLTRGPGQCIFAMDARNVGFLAVGIFGTKLYSGLNVSKLQRIANSPKYAGQFATLLDNWITDLSYSLTRDMLPHPKADFNLTIDDTSSVKNNQRVRSNKGILWVKATSGQVFFIGMEELEFGSETLYFPLTPYTWVDVLLEDEENALPFAQYYEPEFSLTTHSTVSIIDDPEIWKGLARFHELVCRCEVVSKKHFESDEAYRLRSKADYIEVVKHEALREIASVLNKELEKPFQLGIDASDEEAELVFPVCKIVGNAMSIDVKNHPDIRKHKEWNLNDKINAVAKASRFRTRPVVLRGEWYKKDQGPMVAILEKENIPVALIPSNSNSYDYINPIENKKQKVNENIASRLNPTAVSFYRPFPDGMLTLKDIIKFGIFGLGKDIQMLMFTAIMIGCLGVLSPYFTGQIFDSVIPQSDRTLLLHFGIALCVAALTSASFILVQGFAILRIQIKMDYSLQAALWDRLLNMPTSFFRQYSVGDLADRASGINKIRDLFANTVVGAVLGGMTSIFYLVIMFKFNAILAIIGFFITMGLVIFTIFANILQLRYQRKIMDMNGKITGLIFQLISGVAKLRVAGAEAHAFRRWGNEFSDMRRVQFLLGKIQTGLNIVFSGFPIFSAIIIYSALVAIQVATEGVASPITTGEFIAFSAAFGIFQTAMLSLSEASVVSMRIIPIYERLKPIITCLPEIDEIKMHPGELIGDIEVSHLHFRYDKNGTYVLKDVSFKVKPGEFIAFVGTSGSGKSTMMRLLLGFEKPETGTIYYDGQDLARLDLREVRHQVGVVLQDSKLLPATIFRNIVGSSSLTSEDAWEAARMAGIDEDITKLPMGMHTVISEGGGGFSGGQRQRLMISRAIVHKPRILLLDEATSALDNRNQEQVSKSLERLQATRVIVAHRLSTIVNADRIYVLENGEVKEVGTYNELMDKNGLFASMAKRQIA